MLSGCHSEVGAYEWEAKYVVFVHCVSDWLFGTLASPLVKVFTEEEWESGREGKEREGSSVFSLEIIVAPTSLSNKVRVLCSTHGERERGGGREREGGEGGRERGGGGGGGGGEGERVVIYQQ